MLQLRRRQHVLHKIPIALALRLHKQSSPGRAISLQRFVSAQINRAFAYFSAGDFTRAIGDFTEVLRIDPRNTMTHEGRGDAYFLVGRFGEAADDFAATLAINRGDVHDGLWLYLARHRAQRDSTREFRDWLATVTDHSWPYPVLQYYAGAISRDEFVAASKASDPAPAKQRQCQLNAYLGAYESLQGNRAAGRRLFVVAKRQCDRNFVEYMLAASELKH